MKTLQDYRMSINVEAMYNNDLASIYFKDSFETLSNSKAASILYFTDGKEFDWDINKLSKKDLLEIIGDDELFSLKNSKEELINELLSLYKEKELFAWIVRDHSHLLNNIGFKMHESKGYSQGDYCYVVSDLDDYIDDKEIDKILWDNPINCHIELIFEKELENDFSENYKVVFNLEEWLSDIYDIESFNKDEVLAAIIKDIKFDISDEQKEQIENCLNNLDFNNIRVDTYDQKTDTNEKELISKKRKM